MLMFLMIRRPTRSTLFRYTTLCRSIVVEHGTQDLLRRLSDPHWLQAFGAVIGMDWHSSGVTTTVCGALKQGLSARDRKSTRLNSSHANILYSVLCLKKNHLFYCSRR